MAIPDGSSSPRRPPGDGVGGYSADGPSDLASGVLSAWLWNDSWPGFAGAINDHSAGCLRVWSTTPLPPGLVAAFDRAGVADRVVVRAGLFTREEMLEAAQLLPFTAGLNSVGPDVRGRGVTVEISFDAPALLGDSVVIGSGVAVPVVEIVRAQEPEPGDIGPADLTSPGP